MIKTIDRILDEHSNERGLILDIFYSKMPKNPSISFPKKYQRIRICHSRNKDGKTQDEVISDHAK